MSNIIEIFDNNFTYRTTGTNGWRYYDCPLCSKPKMYINEESNSVSCWVCSYNTFVVSFLRINGVTDKIDLGERTVGKVRSRKIVLLPRGFTRIKEGDTPEYNFLKKRGLSFLVDNKEYPLGLSDAHKGYIVFPNISKTQNVIGYYLRAYVDNLIPHIVKFQKSNLFNYREIYSDTVYVVESPICALTIGNGIAYAQSSIDYKRIIQLIEDKKTGTLVFIPDKNGKKKFYEILLDEVKKAVSLVETEVKIKVLNLNTLTHLEGNDVNSLGKEAIFALEEKTECLTIRNSMYYGKKKKPYFISK
jgi:hypothetical protein